jgi:mannosyl-oligosaccharide glucosidase
MKYGWSAHDGRNFGIHDIYENAENGFSIRTTWVKRNGGSHGGDWTARTSVTPFTNENSPPFVSFLFYFATDYTGWIKTVKKTSGSSILVGETRDVGKFKAKIEIIQPTDGRKILLDQATGNITVVLLKESLIQNGMFARLNSKVPNLKEYIGLRPGNDKNYEDANFIVYQVSGFLPFEFEVIFESDSLREELELKNKQPPVELKGQEFDSTLAELHDNFASKFENTFKLKEKNYTQSAVVMAQSALSNMLGGIGFFSGKALVRSLNSKDPVYYWPANLYTAVPSRSFFPRGFLWDEG